MFKKIGKWFKDGFNQLNENAKAGAEVLGNPASTEEEKAEAIGHIANSVVFEKESVDYVGGHYNIGGSKENINVIFIPSGILLSSWTVGEYISWEEIKSLDIKTEEEISKDVTLTRLVAFGVYALALKKKRKKVSNFLVINCEKNGLTYSVVLAGKTVHLVYKKMFNIMLKQNN